MAPGCTSVSQEKDKQIEQFESKVCSNLLSYSANNQIPLPSTPHPDEQIKVVSDQNTKQTNSSIMDTVDSFEILEQTIMKQKRVSKMKNTDLRLKVLLKRTFNLVCEIMDHENGFDTDTADDNTSDEATNEINEPKCLVNDFDDDDDSSSESESDSDEEDETDSDEDDYVQESINYSKIIPAKVAENKIEDNFNQNNFQNIDLKEYNFYDLGNNIKNEDFIDQSLDENRSNDDHYLSLEPIVTYIEQQSISNKRKLSDEFDQEYFNKRIKSKRSLSSSDDENDEKNSEDYYQLHTNSNCFLLGKDYYQSSNESNLKLMIKSTDNNSYKLTSINFYA